MDAYERLITQMRESGKYYNADGMMIGTMAADGKIKLDKVILDTDDYLMDCNLRINKSKMYFHKAKSDTETYVTGSSHNSTLQEYTNNILTEGDEVLMLKIRDDKYILIAKVVSPS